MMEERSSISVATVPVIKIDVYNDNGCFNDTEATNVANVANVTNNNSITVITDDYSENNRPQRRLKLHGGKDREGSESQTQSGGPWDKKVPRRKYGLGIRNSQPIGIFQKLSPGLFLDTPLSPGCADELTETYIPPRVNKVHKLTLPGATVDSSSEINSNRLTVPSLPSTRDRKISNCDLEELKQTTARLKLPTRRPSFVAWHDRYIKKPVSQRLSETYTIPENEVCYRISSEQKTRIDQSLERIKTDLMEMRLLDKNLAKNLLSLKKEINSYKLEISCQEHEDMLEDAQDELEALQELSEMCDFPLDELNFSQTLGPLKNIGVTRLNLSARRFSTC